MHSGRMWLLCGQRSGCKGDRSALGSQYHLLSNSACCMYVRVLKSLDDASIGKAQLQALLKCHVHYLPLPCPVFRVKIFEEALQEAIAIIGGQAKSGCL